MAGVLRPARTSACTASRSPSIGRSISLVVNSSRGDALSDPGFAQPADLDWVRSTLTDAGVSFTVRQEVRGREASEEVLDVLNELNARLCVIGIRRRSAVGKMLLGSNAFRILMHAPCPVLAIKANADG